MFYPFIIKGHLETYWLSNLSKIFSSQEEKKYKRNYNIIEPSRILPFISSETWSWSVFMCVNLTNIQHTD